MAAGGGEFPIGKVLSFFVVLALTVMPVVSCGPINFKGHEILRNKVPDVTGLTDRVEQGFSQLSGAPRGAEDAGRAKTTSRKPERDTLFPSGETWMWLLYITVFGAGVLSFFVPSGSRARAAVGLYGGVGFLIFLTRFQTALLEGADASAAGMSLITWDAGAYIGLVAFALIAFDGLRAPPRTGRVID